MALIHRTTLTPTKLELLAAWLPTRPWYVGGTAAPELTRAGGFRLDDPEGEVGIEFMVATDTSGPAPVHYLVPLTYRGAPLPDADHALIGTTEHGVLGKRWVYDGCQDPVLITQLLALFEGEAEPQAQSLTDTPDHEVTRSYEGAGPLSAATLDRHRHPRGHRAARPARHHPPPPGPRPAARPARPAGGCGGARHRALEPAGRHPGQGRVRRAAHKPTRHGPARHGPSRLRAGRIRVGADQVGSGRVGERPSRPPGPHHAAPARATGRAPRRTGPLTSSASPSSAPCCDRSRRPRRPPPRRSGPTSSPRRPRCGPA